MAANVARIVYVDASAIVKLVVRERETDGLVAFLSRAELVSSEIAEVEVPRAAYLKTGSTESIERAELVLRRFSLVPLDDDLRRAAARAQPPDLRSLDAVHLVSCLLLADQVEAVVVYDRRLAAAVKSRGLRVETPLARG